MGSQVSGALPACLRERGFSAEIVCSLVAARFNPNGGRVQGPKDILRRLVREGILGGVDPVARTRLVPDWSSQQTLP